MQNLELLTIDDVAYYLKISKDTVKNWLYRSGHTLPTGFPAPVQFMGLLRWRSTDFQKYIDGLESATEWQASSATEPLQKRRRGRPPINKTYIAPSTSS